MGKKLFIVTGEHSGDMHAANVARELFQINPDVQIEGIGGEHLQNAGVKIFSPVDKMSAVGLSLKIILDHLKLGKKIVDYLENEYKPDLVLLVDYGAFNLALSKELKKRGIKTFYFIPPQVWASRKWRLRTIKKNIDKVLTIFPFEEDFYSQYKIDNVYVGHPLIGNLPDPVDKKEFFEKHNLDPNKKLIAVFPGSRMFEIKYLLNVFLGAVKILEKKLPNVQFVFSHATNLKENAFSVPYKTITGENQQLLSAADCAILASGTVALESAIYETPMVIAYRGPILFYLIYLLVRQIKKACLVNIISKKDIVPEYLMFDCEANKIAKGVENIMENPQIQINQLQDFKETLSNKKCTFEVAKIINKEFEENG